MNNDNPNDILSQAETAALLGISSQDLYNMAINNRSPTPCDKNPFRFKRMDVTAFMAAQA